MSTNIRSLFLGTVFGVALTFIGFPSWDEVHRMFTFADLRMTLTFAAAVVFIGLAWQVWARFGEVRVSPRNIHKGTLSGGILFGAGWALCGSCPSIAFVQLGQGQLGALVAIAGMVAGNALFAVINGRFVSIPTNSCAEG